MIDKTITTGNHFLKIFNILTPGDKIIGGACWIRTNDQSFSPNAFLAGKCLRPTRPTLHVCIIHVSNSPVNNYIAGPLPFLKPILPPSATIRLITSSNSTGAKSVCSTHTQ